MNINRYIELEDKMLFAFSDSKMKFNDIITGSDYVKTVTVTCGDLVEKRSMINKVCEFDALPFINYTRQQNNLNTNINEVNGYPSLNKAVGTFPIVITTESNEGVVLQSSTYQIKYIYASFGLGDSYVAYRHLVWNTKYPFTVDLFLPNGEYTGVMMKIDGRDNLSFITGSQTMTRYDLQRLAGSGVQNKVRITAKVVNYVKGQVRNGNHIIDIDIDSRKDGVYLRWLDKMGRLCYRLFKQVSEVTDITSINEYSRESQREPYYTDYTAEIWNSGAQTFRETVESRKIVVGIGVQDKDQIKELKGLLTSNFVDMYKGKDDVGKDMWERVQIAKGSYSEDTSVLKDFTCTVILPTSKSQY